MGRPALPDHAKLDALSALKVRAPAAHRKVWQEVGAELQMTETAFARTSLLLLLAAIAEHKPEILRRAVKRANRSLIEMGYPPVTITEIVEGAGLPERGLLQFIPEDIVAFDEDRPVPLVQEITNKITNFFLGK